MQAKSYLGYSNDFIENAFLVLFVIIVRKQRKYSKSHKSIDNKGSIRETRFEDHILNFIQYIH